jgi:integrase
VFLDWRDQLARTSLRQADYAYGTLARILAWAHNRGLVANNPCAKGGKLYHGTRVDKIWSDDDVARFLLTAPSSLRLAMLLAINTGQRQGDLLRLPWSAYDGLEIKLRQRKTGQHVPIPVADALKAALDAASRQSPIILTNSEGKPWSESGFQGAWKKATTRAGIHGLTFHDLRGTAVVTLARAGCNEVEIYSITGHKPGDVRAILTAHYLPRDAEVAVNAIAKLNQYKRRRADQKVDEKLTTARPTVPKGTVIERCVAKSKVGGRYLGAKEWPRSCLVGSRGERLRNPGPGWRS